MIKPGKGCVGQLFRLMCDKCGTEMKYTVDPYGMLGPFIHQCPDCFHMCQERYRYPHLRFYYRRTEFMVVYPDARGFMVG